MHVLQSAPHVAVSLASQYLGMGDALITLLYFPAPIVRAYTHWIIERKDLGSCTRTSRTPLGIPNDSSSSLQSRFNTQIMASLSDAARGLLPQGIGRG